MDHMKGSSGESLPMQQQQTQQQQQQKLKKKSKNKKKSSRTEATTTETATTTVLSTLTEKVVAVKADSCDDGQDVTGLAVNSLSEQLKQQLHLVDSREVSSSSNNETKVNGLVTEKHVNTNACPNKTNSINSLKNSSDTLYKPVPALNGHHPEEEYNPKEVNEVAQTSIKRTKRKPNNKKNPPTTDNLAATKTNGHCPSKHNNSANPESMEEKEHLHNGFSHENNEEIIQQQLSPTPIKRDIVTHINDNKKTAMTPTITLAKEQNTDEQTHEKEQSTKSLEGVDSPSIESPLVDLDLSNVHIEYKEYESELQMHDIMRLIQAELSEPYSIYTYRYFIYNWPKLCFLAAHGNEYVGAIVCKLGMHMNVRRGYIAMLAVRKEYRKLKIGTTLVQKAIEAMLADKADEVVLETEMSNLPALRLYENLGFVRDKRLFRYYLNGVDALRLKLWFR